MADKKKKKDDGEVVDAPAAVAVKPATPPRFVKIPKLAKSGKSRLPRKEKKAQQKAAAAASRK
ncbi:MAG: hypothetical protein NTW28_15610 [Candidatus Solibacter sp.]|nr:hypothetical protein [Candidatus Solibacter sp.]